MLLVLGLSSVKNNIINTYRAIGGVKADRNSQSTVRKLTLLLLCLHKTHTTWPGRNVEDDLKSSFNSFEIKNVDYHSVQSLLSSLLLSKI
jgi:hypothetical protein